jgi:hypothetical protein
MRKLPKFTTDAAWIPALVVVTAIAACGKPPAKTNAVDKGSAALQQQRDLAKKLRAPAPAPSASPAPLSLPSGTPSALPLSTPSSLPSVLPIPSSIPSSLPSLQPLPSTVPMVVVGGSISDSSATDSPALLAADPQPSSDPSSIPSSDPSPSVAVDPAQSEDYEGTDLTLHRPDAAFRGALHLAGNDAQALYALLDVNAAREGGDADLLPAAVRHGTQYDCYKQAPRTAPDKAMFGCNLYLNYSTGEIAHGDKALDVKGRKPHQPRAFKGDAVVLNADNGQTGTITLSGADARELYKSLQVTIDDGASRGVCDSNTKTGKDLVCKETPDAKDPGNTQYSCSISISYGEAGVFPPAAAIQK